MATVSSLRAARSVELSVFGGVAGLPESTFDSGGLGHIESRTSDRSLKRLARPETSRGGPIYLKISINLETREIRSTLLDHSISEA
jgi:hypothetical protein